MCVLHPTDSEPKTQHSSVPNSSWRGEPTRDLGTEHCSVFEIVREKMGRGESTSLINILILHYFGNLPLRCCPQCCPHDLRIGHDCPTQSVPSHATLALQL